MQKPLVWIGIFAVTLGNAAGAALDINPDNSIFGLRPDAPRVEFQRVLGEPTAVIAMEKRPDRKVQWQDAVLLVRDGDAWRIDDIEYLGDWDFKPGARLSEVLQGVEYRID